MSNLDKILSLFKQKTDIDLKSTSAKSILINDQVDIQFTPMIKINIHVTIGPSGVMQTGECLCETSGYWFTLMV